MTSTIMNNDIPLLSYNSTGWSDIKADFVNTLLLSHSIYICAIQEHFRLKPNLYKLQSGISSDYELFAIPAFKSNAATFVGRPSGGIGFFYHKELNKYVTRIVVPNSHRVQGLKLSFLGYSFVLINSYFPTDARGNRVDDTDLLQTLQDIKYIIDQCGDNCNVILMGDINTDFVRNSNFTNAVINFTVENNLYTLWDNKFSCDFTYCHTRDCNGTTKTFYSVLDHFCVSPETMDFCYDASPIHLAENSSNHDPIYLKLKCPKIGSNINIDINKGNSEKNGMFSSKPQWNHASQAHINHYCEDLNSLLNDVHVHSETLHCQHLHCARSDHQGHLEHISLQLMDCISEAVNTNIPHNSNSIKNHIPGWKDIVKPYKDSAAFWYSIWMSCGRPLNCEIHNIMKHSRNKYHYAIRKVRREESQIRKSKFLQDCLSGKVNDLLKNIKQQRKCGGRSNMVDNATDEKSISETFKNIYSEIYNTHNDNSEVNELLEIIDSEIKSSDVLLIDKITPELVKESIYKISSHKNDEHYLWQSDALKHAVDIVAEPLSDLFKAFLVHGYIPKLFLQCALTPIVKDNNKSKTCSNNYRLIGISSMVLKLFDQLLLNIFSSELLPSSLQFGFLKKSSTTLCTWTLNEVTNYFTNRGSPVYICLLDMTKAFDNIKLNILFEKLRKRLPSVYLRLIIYIYMNQQCYIKWGSETSAPFSISNGVRQGATASPVFFNTYMDELFGDILNSGLGCRINDSVYSILGYADDLTLISPTCEGLQAMIKMVEDYCTDKGLKLSIDPDPKKSKTKCLYFNQKQIPKNLKVYGDDIPWVTSAIHLGHIINVDERTSHDLNSKRCAFISGVHGLRQEMGDQVPSVFMQLVHIYKSSFYGSNLWDLNDDTASKLYSAWNRTIRFTYNIPINTHRYILQELHDKADLKSTLLKRFMNFNNQLLNCGKPEVLNLVRCQRSDVRSTYGRNVRACRNIENISNKFMTPDHMSWKVGLISELLGIRDGTASVVGFDRVELENILAELCIN